MRDIDRAVADLAFIQERMAASTRFRGFAPIAVAGAGALALITAAVQSVAPDAFWYGGSGFVMIWVGVAALSLSLIGVEALARSRRLHGGLADVMIAGTLRAALPFFAAGAIVTFVIVREAPDAIWMLPGLWQLFVALLGFATLATLPRSVAWASAWYLLSGATVLALAASTRTPTPWMMGLPFGVGQLILAILLYHAGMDRMSHD